MKYSRKKSQPIFDRAMNAMVKGVSSNFRFLGEKSTPVIARGKGAATPFKVLNFSIINQSLEQKSLLLQKQQRQLD